MSLAFEIHHYRQAGRQSAGGARSAQGVVEEDLAGRFGNRRIT